MYLTDRRIGHPRSPNDHEELEGLLESFSKQVEEIVNESETISVSIWLQEPNLKSKPRFYPVQCTINARNC